MSDHSMQVRVGNKCIVTQGELDARIRPQAALGLSFSICPRPCRRERRSWARLGGSYSTPTLQPRARAVGGQPGVGPQRDSAGHGTLVCVEKKFTTLGRVLDTKVMRAGPVTLPDEFAHLKLTNIEPGGEI